MRKDFNDIYIKKECLRCDYGYKDHLDAVRWLEEKLKSIRVNPTLGDFFLNKDKKQLKDERKKRKATRKRLTTIKKRNSATKKIQRTERLRQTRKRLTTIKRRNSATKKIQRIIRGTQTRKRLETKKRNSATIKIQTSMRRSLAKIETKRIKLLKTSESIIKRALKSNLGTLKTNLTKRKIEKNNKILEDNLIDFIKLKKILNMRLDQINKLTITYKSRTSNNDKTIFQYLKKFYLQFLMSNNNLDTVIDEIKNCMANNIHVSMNQLILNLKDILRDTKNFVIKYDNYIQEEANKKLKLEKKNKKTMDKLKQNALVTIKALKTSGAFSTKPTSKPKCKCKNKKKCRCGFKKNKSRR